MERYVTTPIVYKNYMYLYKMEASVVRILNIKLMR